MKNPFRTMNDLYVKTTFKILFFLIIFLLIGAIIDFFSSDEQKITDNILYHCSLECEEYPNYYEFDIIIPDYFFENKWFICECYNNNKSIIDSINLTFTVFD